MKKLCVFSDSHGFSGHMLRAIRREEPDLIVHLGDGQWDLDAVRQAFPELEIRSVRGNCDLYSGAPASLCFEVEQARIFAVHGHAHQVKYDRTYQRLCWAALEQEADLVLFGHTHIPYHDRYGSLEILNPGSISAGGRPSYGVVLADAGRITAELRRI